MRARAALAVWLATLGAAVAIIALKMEFTSDLTAFLPKAETPGQALMLAQLSDGIASRLTLIGIDGAAPDRLAAMSKALAGELRASGRFRYVANGQGELTPAERELLFERRYHLSPTVTPERFTVDGLRAALEQMLEQLASPLGVVVRPLLPRDPTGELISLIGAQADQVRPPMHAGVWFDAKRARALLMAESASAGYDTTAQRTLQQTIEGAFARVKGDTDVRLLMTGPAVFALKSQDSIEQDAWQLTLIALALVALLLSIAYRSPKYTLLALIPVLTGLAAAIAAVGLAFGGCHIITIGFGATLIGEAVDYPTYLFAQRDPSEPVRDTAVRVWPTLRLAVLTTVFGSLAMLASSFTGIAQLGLFTVVGVGVAGLLTRYVVPALAPQRAIATSDAWQPLGYAVIEPAIRGARRVGWLVPAVLLGSIVYLAVRQDGLWERDLEKLNPIDEADKLIEQQLRDTLGAPDVRYMVVVRGPSADAVLQRLESVHPQLDALRAVNALAAYDSPARYLPSAATQRARLAALPETAVLESRLQQALAGLPFRDDLFEPFPAELARARNAPIVTEADLEKTALGVGLRATLFASAGGWTGLAPLSVVRDAAAIQRAVDAMRDPAVAFFDLKAESDGIVATHGRRSVVLGAIGLAFIAIVLWFGQRRLAQVTRILVPVLAAIAATAMITVALGTPLTFLHIVSLLMVLGAGVNYSLFFANASDAAPERARTTFSIVVATATTLVGFGVLAFANTPVLRTIGLTVAIGAALSFVLAAAWTSKAAPAHA